MMDIMESWYKCFKYYETEHDYTTIFRIRYTRHDKIMFSDVELIRSFIYFECLSKIG